MSSAADAIDEIRKTELESRRRRHLIIGGSSSLLLILVVAAVVATVITTNKSSSSTSSSGDIQTSSKSVEMICSSTDYTHTCQSSLTKVVKSNNPDPKELVKAAISVIFNEVGAAFNKTNLIKTNDTRIKGAIEDCRELFRSSKDELHTSLNLIIDGGIDRLPDQSHNIRTWLSAVMSYQQTCIDGFPDADLKNRMNEGMRHARELTSNALAIVKQAAKYMEMLNVDGFIGKRRLLEDVEEEEAATAEDGELPSWMPEGDRRTLKEKSHDKVKLSLKPNVTVAKDGSGQFKTISAALENMPQKYNGRYVWMYFCVLSTKQIPRSKSHRNSRDANTQI